MALLYAEKFAKYSDPAHVSARNVPLNYGSNSTSRAIVAAAGRFGNSVLSLSSRATRFHFPFAAVTSSTSVIISMWFKDNVTGLQDQHENLCSVVDTSSHIHWQLLTTPGGGLVLRRANATTTGAYHTHVGSVLGSNVWHHLEVRADMVTSGNVEVRVDGVTVINSAGDFRDGTSDALTEVWIIGSNATRYFDELLICDTAGSTFNNFVGDMRIAATVPDADGSAVNWTASSGTNVSCVDDALGAYNDDTDYISSSTLDQESLFSHGAFTLTGVNSVRFVQLSTMALDDGANTLRQLVRSGGTTYDNGADLNPTTSYNWFVHRRELDPNGSIAWTATSINAAEFGVRARP